MKALKDREHSLFIKPFCIRDTLYPAVTEEEHNGITWLVVNAPHINAKTIRHRNHCCDVRI